MLGRGPHKGGCACGAVRYVLRDTGGMQPYACHCRDCQSRTGSSFMLNLPIALDKLELTGELIQADVPRPDGTSVRQIACPACLTRLYGANSAHPGTAMLRAGTLDESSELVPAIHLWTSSKQSWLNVPNDVPSFETQPANMQDWMKYLRPDAKG